MNFFLLIFTCANTTQISSLNIFRACPVETLKLNWLTDRFERHVKPTQRDENEKKKKNYGKCVRAKRKFHLCRPTMFQCVWLSIQSAEEMKKKIVKMKLWMDSTVNWKRRLLDLRRFRLQRRSSCAKLPFVFQLLIFLCVFCCLFSLLLSLESKNKSIFL